MERRSEPVIAVARNWLGLLDRRAESVTVQMVLRMRFLLIGAFIAVLTAVNVGHWTNGTDWLLLSAGGSAALSSHSVHTYVMVHGLQAGPVSLVVVRLLNLASTSSGVVLAHALLAVELPVVLWVAEKVTTVLPRQGGSAVRRQLGTLAVGLAVAPVWDSLSAGAPHVDDGLALLFAALAMLAVSRRRWLPAAITVGLAAGAKPWAVGAVALLFGLSHHRVRSALVAAAVPLVSWLPFLLGDHRTLSSAASPTLPVLNDAPFRVLHLLPSTAPHWFRTAQLTAILVVALVVAWRRDWRLGFAAAMVTRLLFECTVFTYYDADTFLAVGFAEVAIGRAPWRTFALWQGFHLAESVSLPAGDGPLRLVVLLAVLIAMFARPSLRTVGSASSEGIERQASTSGPLLAS